MFEQLLKSSSTKVSPNSTTCLKHHTFFIERRTRQPRANDSRNHFPSTETPAGKKGAWNGRWSIRGSRRKCREKKWPDSGCRFVSVQRAWMSRPTRGSAKNVPAPRICSIWHASAPGVVCFVDIFLFFSKNRFLEIHVR